MSAFWASWTPCYTCWVRHVLMLALLFKSLEKSRIGTRLLEFGEIRLVINQSVVHVNLEYSPEDRSCLRCLYSEVIFVILIRYVFKHCFLILPLFVAICDIWLPRLTYGVYLILFLKPGATPTHLVLFFFIFTPLMLGRRPTGQKQRREKKIPFPNLFPILFSKLTQIQIEFQIYFSLK